MRIKYIITNNQCPSRCSSPTSENGSQTLELPAIMDQGHPSNQGKRARNSTASGQVEIIQLPEQVERKLTTKVGG